MTRVVFPAPLGPRMPNSSPRRTSRSIPSLARTVAGVLAARPAPAPPGTSAPARARSTPHPARWKPPAPPRLLRARPHDPRAYLLASGPAPTAPPMAPHPAARGPHPAGRGRPTQGREELREQPTTGQWPGHDRNTPTRPVTPHSHRRGRPRSSPRPWFCGPSHAEAPRQGVRTLAGKDAPPGARGTARATHHRPAARRRPRHPHPAGDEPQPSSRLSAQFPAPLECGPSQAGAPWEASGAAREESGTPTAEPYDHSPPGKGCVSNSRQNPARIA